MATAAELRQILKEDANGQNLYDHLTQTLMKILVDRPKNAFEAFELISAEVKANPLTPEQTLARPLEIVPEQVRGAVAFAARRSVTHLRCVVLCSWLRKRRGWNGRRRCSKCPTRRPRTAG
jgi:hypothetical protein